MGKKMVRWIYAGLLNIGLMLATQSLSAQEQTREWHLFANSVLGRHTQDGIGLGVKYLRGNNEKDFLAINLSFNLFPIAPPAQLNAQNNDNKRTLPLMAGYHRRMGRFYLEPQAGIGVFAGRLSSPEFSLPSQGAVFWGIETGYRIKKFSLQVKYQALHTKNNPALGAFFYYGGVGLAYQVSASRKK